MNYSDFLWGFEITEVGWMLLAMAGFFTCWKIAKLIWSSL
jgi:hypothetical protein